MTPKKVYWAGDLFNFKDLLGNWMLADAFNQCAGGRWEAVLPQNSEANAARSTGIRDSDLEMLFSSDAVVANFDGTDLDSGTVVEFCYGKFLDLPTVLLRTDFRHNGDSCSAAGDPWNLMCSAYPRTRTLCIHAMIEWRRVSPQQFLQELAGKIVAALDDAAAEKMISGKNELFEAYKRAAASAGGSMTGRFPEQRIKELIARRMPN